MKSISRVLVRILNHKSFPVMSGAALAMLAALVLRNGPHPVDALVLAGGAGGLFVLWRALLTRQTPGTDTLDDLRALLNNGTRPTLVELYSKHCAACAANRPVVDRLERETRGRLQIIRLDIDEEPGRSLMQELGIIFTPTFIHFDPSGRRVRETIGFVDRARTLFELGRAY